MNYKKYCTGLIAATLTCAGLLSKTESAFAAGFTWNNSWTQPTIQSKSQTGFDHTPFQQFVQAEGVALPNSGQFQLDPTKLKLKYDHDVSVYFINEGAGYRNQLALEATGTTNKTELIFNDISCSGTSGGIDCQGDWGGNALKFGDGVNLGTFTAGTQLDLWLRANGLKRGDNAYIFGTQDSQNPDGLQHVVSYAYNNYILVGFEDLYGDGSKSGKFDEKSDRDFNDVVVVLDIGEDNVKALTGVSVPEPSATLPLMVLGTIGMLKMRRRRQNSVEESV